MKKKLHLNLLILESVQNHFDFFFFNCKRDNKIDEGGNEFQLFINKFFSSLTTRFSINENLGKPVQNYLPHVLVIMYTYPEASNFFERKIISRFVKSCVFIILKEFIIIRLLVRFFFALLSSLNLQFSEVILFSIHFLFWL